jgi:hypothetical protein
MSKNLERRKTKKRKTSRKKKKMTAVDFFFPASVSHCQNCVIRMLLTPFNAPSCAVSNMLAICSGHVVYVSEINSQC